MSSETVLIVEDELIIARDMMTRLKALGCDVVAIAESAQQALRCMEVAKPDLVLMDIGLKGGIDGVEVAAEIGRRWAVPVVYVTGLNDETTMMRASATLPYGYVAKPFSDESFRGSIQAALLRRQMDRRADDGAQPGAD